ncbi:hypothetical protein KRP22_007094 [Phytophthora ramorum]|nr:Protein NLP2 [Phytophthora ramorum]
MPTWTPVVILGGPSDASDNSDSDSDSPSTLVRTYNSRIKPMDAQNGDNRRRRRRRPGESVPGSPLMNSEAYTSADHGSSAPATTPPEQHRTPLAPLSLLTVDHNHAPTTRSPSSPNTARHTGKRRASGEMIHHEEESKATQPTTPQAGNEIRRPDLPAQGVVSTAAHTSSSQVEQELTPTAVEPHTSTQRVSTRRTTTTARWSPSMAGGREQSSETAPQRGSKATSQRPRSSATSAVTRLARPISNATRNINFDMLQPHFERPLQQAADSFGVCTTLLKKICRRNGISNWPYRKICGLRKSIASMAKQVNYFDGDQKRAYADQLEKLEHELQAYLRTGNEPTEDLLRALQVEAASAATEDKHTQPEVIGSENEEKEAQQVPAWTTRPSIAQPQHSTTQIAHTPHEIQTTPPDTQFGGDSWNSRPQGPTVQFPTIATQHRALPSIASILQLQSYSSPSRAASTHDPRATSHVSQYEADPRQPPQWRYFPPTNDDAV